MAMRAGWWRRARLVPLVAGLVVAGCGSDGGPSSSAASGFSRWVPAEGYATIDRGSVMLPFCVDRAGAVEITLDATKARVPRGASLHVGVLPNLGGAVDNTLVQMLAAEVAPAGRETRFSVDVPKGPFTVAVDVSDEDGEAVNAPEARYRLRVGSSTAASCGHRDG